MKTLAAFFITIIVIIFSASCSIFEGDLIKELTVSLPDLEIYQSDLIISFYNQEYFEISDDNGNIIYKYKWNDALSKFADADTIYPLSWNSRKSRYWFYSAMPGTTSYFAYYDRKSNSIKYFEPPKIENISELTFDPDSETILFSDWDYPQEEYFLSESRNNTFTLWWHNMFNKQSIVISTKIGYRFNPLIAGYGKLSYIDKDNKLQYIKITIK